MRSMVGGCPAERTLRLVGGRWKLIVLNQLFHGTLRFSELRRRVNNGGAGGRTGIVSPKMLTQELRQMERDGLIHREVYPEVPPRVEYSLTPLGISLRPVILTLADWGKQHPLEADLEPAPCDREEQKVEGTVCV
jgi:DNA-binding HxlR family transcriptional regulator